MCEQSVCFCDVAEPGAAELEAGRGEPTADDADAGAVEPEPGAADVIAREQGPDAREAESLPVSSPTQCLIVTSSLNINSSEITQYHDFTSFCKIWATH